MQYILPPSFIVEIEIFGLHSHYISFHIDYNSYGFYAPFIDSRGQRVNKMETFQEYWLVQWESTNAKIIIGVYSSIEFAMMVASQTAINQVKQELDTVLKRSRPFIQEMIDAHRSRNFTTVINLWNVELKPYRDDPDLVVTQIKSLNPVKNAGDTVDSLRVIEARLNEK